MLFSTNLLKKYISLDVAPKDLMSMMTLHACEVEHIIERKIPSLVVIGYVISTVKHPNADTLTICQVDCGIHWKYQICTAADNIRPNIYVPVALPGCYLPAIDLTIGNRQMRWEDSNGMICAKIELAIDEDAEIHGIWIMDDDFTDLSPNDIWTLLSTKYLRLDNTILNVDNKTINNRPDLTGLLGMAIEMRTIFKNSPVSPWQIKQENVTHVLEEHNPARALELLHHATPCVQKIQVQTEKCSVYSLLALSNVSIRKSPFYDRLGLIDSGLKSKNNRVDFSNLFMTISGQPIHCFDADTIKGTISVRQAYQWERFTDLTGATHILDTQDIVIADDSGPIALAGVIGGLSTAISDMTKNIVIEIAHFDPVVVRKTSMKIGVRTDAVMRYEKTISPLLSLTSLSLILDALQQYSLMLGDYKIIGMSSVIDTKIQWYASSGQYISFDPIQCIKLLFGREIVEDDKNMMRNILILLGFVIEQSKTDWVNSLNSLEWRIVRIPRRRGSDDMNIAEDLYEEVARIYGYNRINPCISYEPTQYKPFHWLVRLNRICEDILVNQYACDQLQTYPRCDETFFDLLGYNRKDLIQLLNATSPELSYLRPSLIPNLLLAVAKNAKIYSEFILFDSGQTWNRSETFSRYLNKQSFETTRLWIVRYKKVVSGWKDDALLDVKAMIQSLIGASGLSDDKLIYKSTEHTYYHPKKQGEVIYDGMVIGTIAQLHPTILEVLKIETTAQVVVVELVLETLNNLLWSQGYSFQSEAKYQTIQDQILTRDLCFVVDQAMGFGDIVSVVQAIDGIQNVELFDLYQGEHLPQGNKSLAMTITIVWDGSWTTNQINAVMNTAIAEVEKIGGKLR